MLPLVDVNPDGLAVPDCPNSLIYPQTSRYLKDLLTLVAIFKQISEEELKASFICHLEKCNWNIKKKIGFLNMHNSSVFTTVQKICEENVDYAWARYC